MGLLDGLLSQVTDNVDITNLAAKVGLDPAQVEQAVTALAQAHPQPGDTVAQAAETTGLSSDTLQQIVGHIGVTRQAAAEGAQVRKHRGQFLLEAGIVERLGGFVADIETFTGKRWTGLRLSALQSQCKTGAVTPAGDDRRARRGYFWILPRRSAPRAPAFYNARR